MFALLPKDIVTYVYRLVHYDLVEKLNSAYKNSVIGMGTSDKAIDTSYIRFNSAHFHPESVGTFTVNYRHVGDITYSKFGVNHIYNIKGGGYRDILPKNYRYAPIYSN